LKHATWFRVAALAGALAVAAGAFGAHYLKTILSPASLEIWNKAVLYQLIHCIALLCISTLYYRNIRLAAIFFISGIVLFSGSLYVLAFREVSTMNLSWAGPLTPLGGLSFIAGWLSLFLGKPGNE
jgi:uncharacterized membrane protein YgdD (TMEM256/DUF423 family)